MDSDLVTRRTEERALLLEVGRGDRQAFIRLHARYRSLVLHWARQVLGDRWLAEEVTQDVFLELWTIAARFDPSYTAAAWIRTVTTRRAVDRLRKVVADRDRDLRIGVRDTDKVDHLGVERAESVLDRRALQRAIRSLPARQREAVVLRHLVGLSGPETGALLGVPTATAKTRARDGVVALRRVMVTPPGTAP